MTSLIADIETMDRMALIGVWAETFGTPVPKRLSSPFLRRFLAFEAQTRHSGGLPKGFADKLKKATRENGNARSPALKHGGRLLREWNGVTHVVDVTEDGFLWNGQRYSSLSPIARAITGARWSGPRFFGLKNVVPR